MVEEVFRIETLEVIRGKEVSEVIEVAVRVNGMNEIQIFREIMVEEEMEGVEEEMVGVEVEMGGVKEEMVGETILEISNMAEPLKIRSRNR